MKSSMKLDGEKLRAWRKARRLSQAELAERAGVRRETVIRIEQGRSTSFGTIASLAEGLGLDSVWQLEVYPAKVLAGSANGGGSDAVVELSDGNGVGLMDRIEAGETEEVKEYEDRYVEYVAGVWGNRDADTIKAFERDLGWALVGLVNWDPNEGAEAIQRVLRRIRELTEKGGG